MSEYKPEININLSMQDIALPGLSNLNIDHDFQVLMEGGNGLYQVGQDGVQCIFRTNDQKVDFIVYKDKTLAYVHSHMGYPAIYPFYEARLEKPVKAVLMDLDGTSVRSEPFWIWIIECSTARLLGNPKFELEESDRPNVSGHSVSEHLQYCIKKYCPDKTIEEARQYYFEITSAELEKIKEGKGRADAFVPAPGLKDFLLGLKSRQIKIAVVTSGLRQKAWPELLAAFKVMKLGDPRDFYDAIITAGYAVRPGQTGTLGELEAKPHPWLYAEAARVGLGINSKERNFVVGMEDSGAGVISLRLAGFPTIGMSGGNIKESGVKSLLTAYCHNFEEVNSIIL